MGKNLLLLAGQDLFEQLLAAFADYQEVLPTEGQREIEHERCQSEVGRYDEEQD